jgi:hypothetical protein
MFILREWSDVIMIGIDFCNVDMQLESSYVVIK